MARSSEVAFFKELSWYIDLLVGVIRKKGINSECWRLYCKRIQRKHSQKERDKNRLKVLLHGYGPQAYWMRVEDSVVQKQLAQCALDSLNYPEMVSPETKILLQIPWEPHENLRDVLRSHQLTRQS